MIYYECDRTGVCIWYINRYRRCRRRWRQYAQTIHTHTHTHVVNIQSTVVCMCVVCDQIICIMVVGEGVGRPNIIIRVKPRDGPLFLPPTTEPCCTRAAAQCSTSVDFFLFFFNRLFDPFVVEGEFPLSYEVWFIRYRILLLLSFFLYIFLGTWWINISTKKKICLFP